jgi:hypothetical protein
VLWQDGLDVGLALDPEAAVRMQLERDRRHLEDASRFKLVYENPPEHARLFELL